MRPALQTHSASAYQILAKLVNSQLSSGELLNELPTAEVTISNMGTVHHLGFQINWILTILPPQQIHNAPAY